MTPLDLSKNEQIKSEASVNDIIGKTIPLNKFGEIGEKEWVQLSNYLNIYRDKRFETARFLFLKNEEIIDHIAFSSKLPTSTFPYPSEENFFEYKRFALKYGCKIVFIHNHPSGIVEPSDADIVFTRKLQELLKDEQGNSIFLGHIILDHGSSGIFINRRDGWFYQKDGVYYTKREYEKFVLPKIFNQNIENYIISDSDANFLLTLVQKLDAGKQWNFKDFTTCVFLRENNLVESVHFFNKYEYLNEKKLVQKLKTIGLEYGATKLVMFPTDFEQLQSANSLNAKYKIAFDILPTNKELIKNIFNRDSSYKSKNFRLFSANDLNKTFLKENLTQPIKKQHNKKTRKSRLEMLAGKTEITDEEIITLLDLPVEKRNMNPKIFTDKSYKELKDNPAKLEKLANDLKNKPEYLKYHSTYIAKSKLLYQESMVLYNEIPCLIILDEMNIPAYLLPYKYARNENKETRSFADSLKSDVFTDFKRVFNGNIKYHLKTGTEQGKDIFFLINNEKLNHDEIKKQLIRFTNNRKSKNKEGTFLFFSEKDYICYAFKSDKNGFITELPKYDLKQIRLANISKPLHPTRSQTEMSATSSDDINLSQDTFAVNELLPSLLFRGEISILETKKDIENRNQRYFNAVNSLEKLNSLIQSKSIKESNSIFVKKQKESRFYKDTQNLFVKNTNQLYKRKNIEQEQFDNLSENYGEYIHSEEFISKFGDWEPKEEAIQAVKNGKLFIEKNGQIYIIYDESQSFSEPKFIKLSNKEYKQIQEKSIEENQVENKNELRQGNLSLYTERFINETQSRSNEIQLQKAIELALEINTVPLKEIKLNRDNWNKFFPNGTVETPIGTVKLGENQFEKLQKEDRNNLLAAMYETLSNPAIILEKETLDKNTGDFKPVNVYGKSFIREDSNHKKIVESVVIFKNGDEISIGTHNKELGRFSRQIKTADQIIFANPEISRVASLILKNGGSHVQLKDINTQALNQNYNKDTLLSTKEIESFNNKNQSSTSQFIKSSNNENKIMENKKYLRESEISQNVSDLSQEDFEKYIHSEEFISKFGDWEKASRLQKLSEAPTIVKNGKVIIKGKDITEEVNNFRNDKDNKVLRIFAKDIGRSVKGIYHNDDLDIDVVLSMGNIDEIKNHHMAMSGHLEAIQYIPDIIKQGIYIAEEANEDKTKHPNIEKYKYFVSALKIDGVDYTCKSAIGVDKDGNYYYDQRLSQIEKGSLLDNLSQLMSRGKSEQSLLKYDKRLLRICQCPQTLYLDKELKPTKNAVKSVMAGKLYLEKDKNGFQLLHDIDKNKIIGKELSELVSKNPISKTEKDIFIDAAKKFEGGIFEYDGLTYIPVRKLTNEELKLINTRSPGEIWENSIIEKPKNGEKYSLSDFKKNVGKDNVDLFYCIERGKFFMPIENGIINLNEGKIDEHFRNELQEFYNNETIHKIIQQNRPLKFNKEKDIDLMQNVSSVLTEGEIFFQNNKTLGDIRIKFGNPDKDGLSHIIKRRMDKLIQHDGMSKEDAQKETSAILFLALQNIPEAPATKETNGRYSIYKDGIKTCIGKDKNGRYIVSGFDFDDTKQEARDAIKSVNAQYGYAPEFLEIYAQVGATYASLSNNISQPLEKSNNVTTDEPQQNINSVSQAEEELRKELDAAKKQIEMLTKKLEDTLNQNNLENIASNKYEETLTNSVSALDNLINNKTLQEEQTMENTIKTQEQEQKTEATKENNSIHLINISDEEAFEKLKAFIAENNFDETEVADWQKIISDPKLKDLLIDFWIAIDHTKIPADNISLYELINRTNENIGNEYNDLLLNTNTQKDENYMSRMTILYSTLEQISTIYNRTYMAPRDKRRNNAFKHISEYFNFDENPKMYYRYMKEIKDIGDDYLSDNGEIYVATNMILKQIGLKPNRGTFANNLPDADYTNSVFIVSDLASKITKGEEPLLKNGKDYVKINNIDELKKYIASNPERISTESAEKSGWMQSSSEQKKEKENFISSVSNDIDTTLHEFSENKIPQTPKVSSNEKIQYSAKPLTREDYEKAGYLIPDYMLTPEEKQNRAKQNEHSEEPVTEQHTSNKTEELSETELHSALKSALQEVAVPLEKVDFTRDNYNKLFPYSKIETPIESVKMEEHQFEKLEAKQREFILKATHDTLSNPDVIIDEKRKNVFGEEEKSHLYAKSFLINDKVHGIQSVVVSIDNENISISTHERDINNFINKIKKPDQLLYAAAKVRLSVERTTGKQLVTVNPTRESEYVKPIDSNLQQNSKSVKENTPPKLNDNQIVPLTVSEFLYFASQCKTPEEYEKFYNQNYNFKAFDILPSSDNIGMLEVSINGQPTGELFNPSTDQEKIKERKLKALLEENYNVTVDNKLFIPSVEKIKKDGLKGLQGIKNNLNLYEQFTGTKIKEPENSKNLTLFNPATVPEEYRNLYRGIDIENLSKFTETPESAYIQGMKIPRFGLTISKNGILRKQEFENWRFDCKVPEHGAVRVMRTKQNGDVEYYEIDETTYKNLVERNITMVESLKQDRTLQQRVEDYYKYYEDVGAGQNDIRQNTAVQFWHNFKVLCNKQAFNENEAIEVAKYIYDDMPPSQKEKLHSMEIEYKDKTGKTFMQRMLNYYKELAQERSKNPEFGKAPAPEMPLKAGYAKPVSELEAKLNTRGIGVNEHAGEGSLINPASIEPDIPIGTKIDERIDVKVGDTVPFKGIKVERFPEAENPLKREPKYLPLQDCTVKAANKELNVVILQNKDKNIYRIPLSTFVEIRQKVEKRINKKRAKGLTPVDKDFELER